mmetsp:Transcript_49410/g.142085  ORF Transcript_49410/g.142085 Transcript_49410/m.142085 type:complete len:373 (+) Transcript_49410:121-1239(+)
MSNPSSEILSMHEPKDDLSSSKSVSAPMARCANSLSAAIFRSPTSMAAARASRALDVACMVSSCMATIRSPVSACIDAMRSLTAAHSARSSCTSPNLMCSTSCRRASTSSCKRLICSKLSPIFKLTAPSSASNRSANSQANSLAEVATEQGCLAAAVASSAASLARVTSDLKAAMRAVISSRSSCNSLQNATECSDVSKAVSTSSRSRTSAADMASLTLSKTGSIKVSACGVLASMALMSCRKRSESDNTASFSRSSKRTSASRSDARKVATSACKADDSPSGAKVVAPQVAPAPGDDETLTNCIVSSRSCCKRLLMSSCVGPLESFALNSAMSEWMEENSAANSRLNSTMSKSSVHGEATVRELFSVTMSA